MFAAIIGLFTGAIGPLFTWLTTKDDAKKEMAIAQMQAYVEAYKTQTQFKIVQWGWWGTRWLLAFAAFGPIWHWTQVFLDSSAFVPGVFYKWGIPYLWVEAHVIGSWRIPVPPGEYGSAQQTIILSFFAVGVAGSALSTTMKAIVNRNRTNLEAKRLQLDNDFRATLIREDRDHEFRMTQLKLMAGKKED